MASSCGTGNVGYGLDYDEEKAMAEMAEERKAAEEQAMNNKKDEDASSVDSHLSEDAWLLPKGRVWLEKVGKGKETTKEEEKKVEEEIKDVVKVCNFCGLSPCVLNKVYDEMMYVAEGYEDSGLDNKYIRYELYCFVTKKLWGPLGRGNRKVIPHCIMAEIHDAFPATKVTDYVGFKEAGEDSVSKEDDTSK